MVLGPCELCAISVGWPRACGCRFDPVTARLMADPASVADPAGPCCGDLAWPDLRAR
jgi:hypothetical protein